MPTKGWTSGPIVLGVEWKFSPHLIRTAAELATALGQHLVCAFVDPAGYLTEWERTRRGTHIRSIRPPMKKRSTRQMNCFTASKRFWGDPESSGPSACLTETFPRRCAVWPKTPGLH